MGRSSYLKGILRHKLAILFILCFSFVALATIIPDNTTIVGDLTLQGTNGIDVNPGSDTNADVLTIGVTGSPSLKWNESEDAFRFINSLLIGTSATRTSTVNASSIVSNLAIKDESGTDPKGILLEKHSASDAVGGNIMISRSRGSIASPTVVDDTDLISRIVGLGFDGTDYAPAGDISILISGTPSGSSMPGAIVFRTTATGSTTPGEAMRIVPHGGLGLKSSTVDASSVLDLGGVTRGSRPAPLMSQTQRDAIVSPANALMVFNNDFLTYDFYNGSAWENFATNSNTLTLTNKTLTSPTLTTPSIDIATLDGQGSTPSNPSSGFYKAYVKDSTGKLTILNSAGTETAVGGGAGGINLIGDGGNAEAGTTGWATFADAASSRPVDGTGGSANITWTTSSSSPLYESNSFVFTKDASDRQGQGVSYDFTVQPAHQAKVLQISFDYIVGSGTFVAGTNTTDSDLIAYIYDVTNSQLIEPSSFKFLSNSSTIADKFNATFQTSATGTSYRLILYCASTSASAYTVKLDNISVSPSTYTSGFAGDDFTNVAAVAGDFTGFGTPTSMEVESRRNGDVLEIRGKFVSGTSTATEGRVALRYKGGTVTAAGTDKIASIKIVGKAVRSSTAGVDFVVLAAPNTSYVTFGIQDASRGGSGSQNGDQLIASGATFTFFASVPILGWSSSVQMADQTSTRVVAARAYRSSNQTVSTAAETDIVFNATSSDDVGGFNTSTGEYTVKVPGKYRVKTSVYISSAASEVFTLLIYKNGAAVAQRFFTATADSMVDVSDVVNCVTGDTIKSVIDSTADTSYTVIGNSTASFTTIERLSGPSAIAATESVNCRYSTSSTASISDATWTIIDFNTKSFDSHGAVTTGASWKFTAQIGGVYEVSAACGVTGGGGWATNESIIGSIYKGGVFYDYLFRIFPTSGHAASLVGNGLTTIKLNAGEYIDFRFYQDSGASLGLNGALQYIDIKRVGN